MITVKINLDKVDKSKIFQGKKGKYLDLVLWENKDFPQADQYGSHYLVKQSGEKGEKLDILGSAKIFEAKETNDDLPF